MNSIHMKLYKNELFNPVSAYYQKHILAFNTIGSPSAIAFKNDFGNLLFDINAWMRLDVDFYHALYEKYGDPIHVSNVLIVNEIHNNQASFVLRKPSLDIKNKLNQEIKYLQKKHNYRFPNKYKWLIFKVYIKFERSLFSVMYYLRKGYFQNIKPPLINIYK